MPNERAPDHDDALSAALDRFARNVAGASVSVRFAAGVASITGSVASPSAARALEDLIRWHRGVERIESHLEVQTTVAPRASRAN
jgi:osmotically-inducible protein OsmY